MKPKIENLTELLKDVKAYETANGMSYVGKIMPAERNVGKTDMLFNALKTPTKASSTVDSYKKMYINRLFDTNSEMPPVEFNKNMVVVAYALYWSRQEMGDIYMRLFNSNIQ
jgi:hypothetical protein